MINISRNRLLESASVLSAADVQEAHSANYTTNIRVLRSVRELDEIREAWKAWPGHRDSDMDFFLTVMTSSPEAIRPHVIAAFRNGQPDAILIGRIDLTTLALRVAYWDLPAPQIRLLTFVIGAQRGNSSPEVSALLLKEALKCLRHGEADMARLEFVKIGCPLYGFAVSLPGFGRRDYGVVSQPHWSAELAETYEGFLKRLSGDFRWQIRRKSKRIRAAFASVFVRCFESPDELGVMIRDVETIAAKSYQRTIGVGFSDSHEMVHRLLWQMAKGWLRTYVLYLDDKPAAFWVGVVYDHVFYSEFIGFDPIYSRHSPGIFLQSSVLEDLCVRQVRAVDFGPGHARYKAQLGTACYQEASLYLYPPRIRGLILNLLRTTTVFINKSLKAAAARANVLLRLKRVLRGKKKLVGEV